MNNNSYVYSVQYINWHYIICFPLSEWPFAHADEHLDWPASSTPWSFRVIPSAQKRLWLPQGVVINYSSYCKLVSLMHQGIVEKCHIGLCVMQAHQQCDAFSGVSQQPNSDNRMLCIIIFWVSSACS